jgi:hypothetical protein
MNGEDFMIRWTDDASLRDWLYDHVTGLKETIMAGDAEKMALVLQRWVGQHATFSHKELLLNHGKLSTAALLEGVLSLQGGLWCGGVAELFASLVRLFPGFYAAKWSYGYRDENVSHVTTLIGTKAGNCFVADAYLGYLYLETGTKKLLSFGSLIKRIMDKDYDSITRLDIPQRRPAIARPGHSANRFAWLYRNRPIPEPRDAAGLLVYDGAECSFPALFRPGSQNRKRIEKLRGDTPFEEFMHDLILVAPELSRFAPNNSETWTEFSVMRNIMHTISGE